MEDRYLFKAKRVDNGEWVLGVLFDGENHCIIGQEIKFSPYQTNECKIVGYEVDRNTICQSLVILHGDVLLKMLMEWQYKHLKSKFLRNRYILQI